VPDTEKFTFARWTWDVDAALKLAADLPIVQVPVPQLAMIAGLIRINPAHLPDVDVTQPILLAPFPDQPAYIPIDGWHRIHRAINENLPTLPARFLTDDLAAQVLTERRGR
jgi:hypothetical protein